MKKLKPEKLVESRVMNWAKSKGFWLNVVEAKATYSNRMKMYLRGQAPLGFPDLNGITPCGFPCYIELKAPGKRFSARIEQMQHLVEVIRRGGFAAVIDSELELERLYDSWRESNRSRKVLLEDLPKKFRIAVIQSIFSPKEFEALGLSSLLPSPAPRQSSHV